MTKLLKRRGPTVTHYDVLGCSPIDSIDQLHDSYLKLAFELHPDRGGDADKFKAVALAWGVLKNTESRQRYDAQLKLESKLNCAGCKGTGRKSTWIGGSYQRNVACQTCAGRGHV